MLFILGALFFTTVQAHDFENVWQNMQKAYHDFLIDFDAHDQNLAGAYWMEQKNNFSRILLGDPDKNLWQNRAVFCNMIRSGFEKEQKFELCYLKSCLSDSVKQLVMSYKDTDFNGMPFNCQELSCSTNTLGHLFYAAKIMEKARSEAMKIETIVELGGGYGNLARILKSFNPEATIILIDLPEFLALQYLFLVSTMPSVKIIAHKSKIDSYEKGCIHLVPVSQLSSLDIQADVFISTFALSESPHVVQKLTVDQKFFNASLIYITGQLNGWNKQLNFEQHDFVINQVRKLYGTAQCNPFHIFNDGFESYEIMAHDIFKFRGA